MDFKFKVADILRRPISIFSYDENIIRWERKYKNNAFMEKLAEIINELGLASAKAQSLRTPITSLSKLRQDDEARLYILRPELPEEAGYLANVCNMDRRILEEKKKESGIGPDKRVNKGKKDESSFTLAQQTKFEKSLKDLQHNRLMYYSDIQNDQESNENLPASWEDRLAVFVNPLMNVNSKSKQKQPKDAKNRDKGDDKTAGKIYGILKVGHKKLFMTDDYGRYHEISPLCVLDFYVHESVQRGGYGKILFDFMLMMENIGPDRLAYDRPSHKLMSFLAKHYNLTSHIPQGNKFVLFRDYGLNTITMDDRVRHAQWYSKIPEQENVIVKNNEEPSNDDLHQNHGMLFKRRDEEDTDSIDTSESEDSLHSLTKEKGGGDFASLNPRRPSLTIASTTGGMAQTLQAFRRSSDHSLGDTSRRTSLVSTSYTDTHGSGESIRRDAKPRSRRGTMAQIAMEIASSAPEKTGRSRSRRSSIAMSDKAPMSPIPGRSSRMQEKIGFPTTQSRRSSIFGQEKPGHFNRGSVNRESSISDGLARGISRSINRLRDDTLSGSSGSLRDTTRRMQPFIAENGLSIIGGIPDMRSMEPKKVEKKGIHSQVTGFLPKLSPANKSNVRKYGQFQSAGSNQEDPFPYLPKPGKPSFKNSGVGKKAYRSPAYKRLLKRMDDSKNNNRFHTSNSAYGTFG